MRTNIRLVYVAFIFVVCAFLNSALAQGGAKWTTGLNGITTGDALGTNNNFPLNFYTNNSQRMSLGTNGVLQINGLSGTSFRFIQADANGNLVSFPMGTATDVLYGNGTWGPLPASATAWNVTGTTIWTNNGGNVGIGTNNPNPLYKLEVIGDARISNNLFVGGGIIITDDLRANNTVTTGVITTTAISTETLDMGTGGVVEGTPVFTGDITGTSKLTVAGNSNFQSDVNIGNDATVGNKLNIGPANTDFQLSFTPSPGPSVPSSLIYGKLGNLPPTPIATCNPEAYVPPMVNNFGGQLSLFHITTPNNQYVQGTSVLDIGAQSGTSFISSRFTPLTINPICNQNIYLMGQRIGVGTNTPAERLHVAGNTVFDGTTLIRTGNAYPLLINDQTNGNNFKVRNTGATFIGKTLFDGNGSMLTVGQPNSNDLALSLVNNNPSNSSLQDFFNVYGNGYTEIKIYNPASMPQPVGGSPRALTIKDMTTNKDLFVINANGKTYAREVEISLVATFPDYVFNKDYQLKSIEQVEDYIKQNKHLPGFEKAEYYEKNGINVNEMFIKQQEKIEELTLYIIELKKEIENIKKNSN